MPRHAVLITFDTKSGEREERVMDDKPVPNLAEMDERQARRFLEEMFSTLSAEKEYALRHEDYAMEMPQSGERIRGPENMRAFQRAFTTNSTPPSIRIRRVLVREKLWVVEGVNDYGEGGVYDVVLIVELKDGKWWRDTRYYAQPFEAPEWRAQWVERMEA
jgi:SnoaL-like protein